MKTGTYGWKSVFAFTFRQTAKSKAFKVSSVIIIVLVFAIALLAGVLPALIGSRSTSDDGDITGDGDVYKRQRLKYSRRSRQNRFLK